MGRLMNLQYETLNMIYRFLSGDNCVAVFGLFILLLMKKYGRNN